MLYARINAVPRYMYLGDVNDMKSKENQVGGKTCGMLVKAESGLHETFADNVCQGICLNKAEAEIEWREDIKRWEQKGNKTDCALLAFAHELGVNYMELHNRMICIKRLYKPMKSLVLGCRLFD